MPYTVTVHYRDKKWMKRAVFKERVEPKVVGDCFCIEGYFSDEKLMIPKDVVLAIAWSKE